MNALLFEVQCGFCERSFHPAVLEPAVTPLEYPPGRRMLACRDCAAMLEELDHLLGELRSGNARPTEERPGMSG